MAAPSHVFLVPGFFGFVDLGNVPYFRHVERCLERAADRHGLRLSIHVVGTHATASLRRRAARLADIVQEHAGDDDHPIHLVGHSSGGLDARLMVTPGASLPTDVDVEPLAARVRSVVTVATPHLGTPLASFFEGLFGQRMLRLLSLSTVELLRFGRLPRRDWTGLAGLLRRPPSDPETDAAIEGLEQALLAEAPAESRGPFEAMLQQMRDDQALIPQLQPEALELFNAATNDRPGVRYGCVVARAPRPGLRSAVRAGARPPAQATFAVFAALHRLTARMPERRSRWFGPDQAARLEQAFGEPVTWSDGDGIVPTCSQLWGELLCATRADHLDVVGHFADRRPKPAHFDWLASGSGFDRIAFEGLWGDVARHLARAESGHHSSPPKRRAEPRTAHRAASRLAIALLGTSAAFAAYESLRGRLQVDPGASWLAFVALVSVLVLLPLRLLSRARN